MCNNSVRKERRKNTKREVPSQPVPETWSRTALEGHETPQNVSNKSIYFA